MLQVQELTIEEFAQSLQENVVKETTNLQNIVINKAVQQGEEVLLIQADSTFIKIKA